MRASRASSVREAERRNKHAQARQRHHSADRSPDRHSLRRQDRLTSDPDSVGEQDPQGACSKTCCSGGNHTSDSPLPKVLFTTPSGFLTADNNCTASDMNTLAAQTAACSGGSSRSINKLGNDHCHERSHHDDHHHHGNNRHHHHHGHAPLLGSTSINAGCGDDDDVLGTSVGSLRARQEMRWELRYFFMNPYLKYKKRGRKPWKLLVQLLKIIFVTLQLVLFGTSQFSLNQFYEGNRQAFEHIFLKNWSVGFDSQAYPRSNQLYAIFETQEFYEHIDYVAKQFANLRTDVIGTYSFDPAEGEARKLHVHQVNYAKVDIKGDGHFNINQSIVERYLIIPVNKSVPMSVKDYLAEHNQAINIDTMKTFELNFSVSSIHLKDSESFITPDCIRFNITIMYDYTSHNGRLPIALYVGHEFFHNCSNKYDEDTLQTATAKWMMALDVFVIVLSVLSLIMCIRSFIRAQHLKVKTVRFFRDQYNAKLSQSDRLEFLNLWYVIIIVSDACTMSGSIVKILIQVNNDSHYDTCSLLLGTGCFMVWFGVLRYLGFFNKYNILIITLKKAMPNVLRFLLCAGIIYAAYAFFGWIVLGPYHPKFRTLSISVECMFSLINGDDMYATFREMSDRNTTIYLFSRIYLYTFISLFIYVVLSLIIAVIMDTYETMKEYQQTGFVEGRLHSFMAETCDDDIPGRGSFHTQSSRLEKFVWRHRLRARLCCRCKSWDSDDDLIQ